MLRRFYLCRIGLLKRFLPVFLCGAKDADKYIKLLCTTIIVAATTPWFSTLACANCIDATIQHHYLHFKQLNKSHLSLSCTLHDIIK